MSNKFFPKRKKKKMSFKIIFFLGLFFCLLGILIYFSIWSSFLRINKIEIKSEKNPVYYKNEDIIKIAEEKLDNKIFRIIPQNTITLVPINKIKEAILNKFSEIKEISIIRNLTDMKLVIDIKERESVGIWCKAEIIETILESDTEATSTEEIIRKSEEKKIGECFQIDKEGVIYRESLLVKSSSILNIFGFKNQSASVRDSVISPEIINFILEAKEKAGKIKTDKILSVFISDFDFISIEDLRGTTSWGWQIYFNPVYSLDSQINALELILNEEIKDNYKSLEYIDLRIEGRVYYKLLGIM